MAHGHENLECGHLECDKEQETNLNMPKVCITVPLCLRSEVHMIPCLKLYWSKKQKPPLSLGTGTLALPLILVNPLALINWKLLKAAGSGAWGPGHSRFAWLFGRPSLPVFPGKQALTPWGLLMPQH